MTAHDHAYALAWIQSPNSQPPPLNRHPTNTHPLTLQGHCATV